MKRNAQKRILGVNTDIGGANALVPCLRRLQARGDTVVAYTSPDAPANSAFRQGGIPTENAPSWSMRTTIQRWKPDVVLAGISTADDGSEKLALYTAIVLEIPTIVVLETWPKRWLDSPWGTRDFHLYSQATCICVPDTLSRELMIERGYNADRIVVTGNPCNDDLAQFNRDRLRYRTEYRKRLGLPQDAVVALYAATDNLDNASEARPDSPSWIGISEEEVVTEFLTAMREHGSRGNPPLHAFLRQKPSYGTTRARELIANLCPTVAFDNAPIDRGIPALLAADVVIGRATIVVQTAALLGIPAVYYMPQLSCPDPMVTNAIGLTVPMTERGALTALIANLGHNAASTLSDIKLKMSSMPLPDDATGNVINLLDQTLGST